MRLEWKAKRSGRIKHGGYFGLHGDIGAGDDLADTVAFDLVLYIVAGHGIWPLLELAAQEVFKRGKKTVEVIPGNHVTRLFRGRKTNRR